MIVAGTGHRPDKLGGYGLEVHDRLVFGAKNALLGLRPRVTAVISGGALGWDQALADAAIETETYLKLALPFEGFESKWPRDSQYKLKKIIEAADEVHYVNEPPYAAWKMQARNKWMVDNCDIILALWNGSTGGTANCIEYANKIGKPIQNLWESMYDNAR